MLPLLFSQSQAVNNKWPIRRNVCGANINGSVWSMPELQDRGVEKFDFKLYDLNYTAYFKICGEFTEADADSLPSYAANYKFISMLLCWKEGTVCYPAGSKFDLDYAPYDEKDFSKGVSLQYLSHPVQLLTSTIFKFTFDVACDASQTNSKKAFDTPDVDFSWDRYSTIKINFPYAGGCPTKADPPAPTPMYSPQCDYDERDPNKQDEGISMDLHDNNGGPYGHMYPAVYDNSHHVIFYQPCERSYNPGNSTDQTLASVWDCNEDVTKCINYGIADDHMKMARNRWDINQPVTNNIYNGEASRQTIVSWSCNEGLPANSIKFYDADYISDDKYNLEIKVSSQESCVHTFDPPDIPTEKCKLKYKEYDFDATKLNAKENVGYVSNVRMETPLGGNSTVRMHFQPCGSIYCPKDAKCDQFEDAYLWICKPVTIHTDKYDCDPYGLAEHNVTTQFVDPYNFHSGIQMKYRGGDNLEAYVTYLCDESLADNEIRIDNTVEVSQSTLRLEARTKQACSSGENPDWHFYLPWPHKDVTPTPTPLVHPQTTLFMRNETHHVALTLSAADREIDEQEFDIASRGKRCHIWHFFAPDGNITCPTGWDCKEFSNMTGAGWICYKNEQKEKVCFPDAVRTNIMTMRALDGSMDKGAEIVYNGVYNYDLELNVYCDKDSPYDLPLSSAPSYHLNTATGGQEISFESTSSMVCPKKFATPRYPVVKPTATPNPQILANISWDQDFDEDGHQVELNFNRIPDTMQSDIALGAPPSAYELATIVYSPVDRIPCPADYKCPDMEKGNIWKCFKNETDKYCYVIGNAEYGMNTELAPNNGYIHADVAATYWGGANGARTTLLFVCNHSVPKDTIRFDPVGVQRYNGKAAYAIMYVHTMNVCWDVNKESGLSGGAIFLTIVFVGATLYFAGGALVMFFIKGTVALPNAAFWESFWAAVQTGAVYLFTCGKKTSFGVASYDAI